MEEVQISFVLCSTYYTVWVFVSLHIAHNTIDKRV